jgi:hypothetical protein
LQQKIALAAQRVLINTGLAAGATITGCSTEEEKN